jgi:hypothetical protein
LSNYIIIEKVENLDVKLENACLLIFNSHLRQSVDVELQELTFTGGGSFLSGFSIFCSVSGAGFCMSALSDFLVSISDNTTKK